MTLISNNCFLLDVELINESTFGLSRDLSQNDGLGLSQVFCDTEFVDFIKL